MKYERPFIEDELVVLEDIIAVSIAGEAGENDNSYGIGDLFSSLLGKH